MVFKMVGLLLGIISYTNISSSSCTLESKIDEAEVSAGAGGMSETRKEKYYKELTNRVSDNIASIKLFKGALTEKDLKVIDAFAGELIEIFKEYGGVSPSFQDALVIILKDDWYTTRPEVHKEFIKKNLKEFLDCLFLAGSKKKKSFGLKQKFYDLASLVAIHKDNLCTKDLVTKLVLIFKWMPHLTDRAGVTIHGEWNRYCKLKKSVTELASLEFMVLFGTEVLQSDELSKEHQAPYLLVAKTIFTLWWHLLEGATVV